MNTSIGASQANLSKASIADTNANNYYIGRWVSPTLYQSRIDANTWTVEYGAKESNAAANFPRSSTGVMYVNCYVWQPSDGTKIGTVLDGNSNSDGEEASTTQTVINFTFAGAAVTGMKPGNACLIIELWAQVTQANGTQRTDDFYYDGTTENSTSNEAAFLNTPENLVFTKVDLSATELGSSGTNTSTANTTQYYPIVGTLVAPTTTEDNTKVRFKKAGTLSNLRVIAYNNGITGGVTFTLRKNTTTDTALTVTHGTGITGIQEDDTHTVSVAVDDYFDLKGVPNAATGTYSISNIALLFTPTDGIPTQIMGICDGGLTFSTASTTRYLSLYGRALNTSTENNAKCRIRKGGTMQKLIVFVSSNSRTTNTTFKSRKNGADGNLSVTFGNGETGVKEDLVNSDTVAAGDDYNFSITTSTGTENIVYGVVSVHFYPDQYMTILANQYSGTTTLNANTTGYIPYNGHETGTGFGTESQVSQRTRIGKGVISDLQVWVKTNGVTADSTLTLMVNGVASSLVATLTNATTGLFSDNTHEVNVGNNDRLDYKIVTGATGTSMDISTITSSLTTGVTKPLTLKWNINGRISKALILKWNIIGRISKALSLKWNINARISKALSLKWNITGRISKALILKWNIIGRISKSLILKWNIIGRISKSLTLKWNILNYISKQLTLKWNILEGLTRVSKDLTLKWNVIGRVSKSLVLKWNVLNYISKSLVLKWNIIGRISKSLTLKWNILNYVSKSLVLKWNIVGRISKPLTLKWNIQERISKALTLKWNIVGRISKSLTLKWDITGRISKSLTLIWVIMEPGLERVSKALVLKWDVIGRVSKPLTLKWNIVNRISKSLTLKWNVLNYVTKSLTLKWNIVNRISKPLILKWNIIGRISKPLTLKWDVIGRVSKPLILKWNVIERVSKPLTLKWNVLNYISKSLTLKWNVLNYVSKSLTLKWNIIERISKSLTVKWNIIVIPTTLVSKVKRWIFTNYSESDPAKE